MLLLRGVYKVLDVQPSGSLPKMVPIYLLAARMKRKSLIIILMS